MKANNNIATKDDTLCIGLEVDVDGVGRVGRGELEEGIVVEWEVGVV